MTVSKFDNYKQESLMIQAMAYRVKYRKATNTGQAIKTSVHIQNMGAHRKNRGGIYPSGLRCKNLCTEVLTAGFSKEEVNHACIAVEEAPTQEILNSSDDISFVSACTYNAQQVANDDLLSTCFHEPFNDVRQNLLSHNHIMLVLRAFLTKAKWDLPTLGENNLNVCDADGRLSLSAVAASMNGKELAEVLEEGFQVEILSWKMDVEEPNAASVISQALNQPQQMAMRTSELTAVAVLKGEIIVQMSKDVSQRVAFQTVRDRVRSQLHTAADDPDLAEIFGFLIHAGVGKNTYVDHFLEWTGPYVDSSKRQLRFAAFAVVNKMCEQAVWSKIAVLKRAYRKKPTNGFCPGPETAWGDFTWADLKNLEDMLRFFHGAMAYRVDEMPPHERIKFLANIDIAAADAFFAAKDSKLKHGEKKIQSLLLESMKKFLTQLELEGDEEQLKSLVGRAEWITFNGNQEQAKAQSTAVKLTSAPTVIRFDELHGTQLNQQLDFTASPESKSGRHNHAPQKLPWREWHSGVGSSMGDAQADKAAAIAVLQGLHVRFAVDQEPIEVWHHEGLGNYVTATRKVKSHGIMLPLCVPRQSKVLDSSEHPHKAELKFSVFRPTEDLDVEVSEEATIRDGVYFLNPEFKAPTLKAVKDASAADSAAVADEWICSSIGDDTMHPFWAVRRMTAKQLAMEIASQKCVGADGVLKVQKLRPRFNCRMELQQVSCCTVGVVKSQSVATTRVYQVPFLINSLDLEEDEQLILEVDEKRDKEAKKRGWKEAFKEDEKKTKLAKAQSNDGATTTRGPEGKQRKGLLEQTPAQRH